MRIFTSVSFLLILTWGVSWGQTRDAGPVAHKLLAAIPTELEYPVSLYKEATAQSQNLYNGRGYFIYDSRMKEHQFFEDRRWDKGMVIFEGQRFDSIPMLYDIVKDELVVRHMSGSPIILPAEKVESFFTNGQVFKWFESGKGIDPEMRTGFYNLFYEGPTRFLVRRTKQRQEKIVERRVITIFTKKDFYYLWKDNQYHFVRSKRSVLKLFPEHKRAMRKVLREENIQYRADRAQAIGRMIATHDASAQL